MQKGFLLNGVEEFNQDKVDSDSSDDEIDRDAVTEDDKLAMIFIQ